MSGHSKWSNIKHRKGKSDAAKAKVFTKLGRELAVAVKAGGSDPLMNSKLADIISKCKAANMPNDNITRGIKKAAGELGNINYEEIIYEGYGILGSAVIVTTLTDKKNRTAGDVRHIFDKHGGSMGTTNSVSYMFDKKGIIVIENNGEISEDSMMEYVFEAGAEDFVMDDEVFEIYTQPSDFHTVKEFFEAKEFKILEADVQMLPQTKITLDGENLTKFETMLEKFEENDDVQNIYHNVEF